MIIKQDSISTNQSFRNEFRKYHGIKVLQPQKGNNGEKIWYWEINPAQIEWDTLNEKLASHYPEEINRLQQILQVTEIDKFENLFTDISKTVNPPQKRYRIEGDIRRFYTVKNFHIFIMMDHQNLNQTIRIKIPIGKIPPETFEDRRVIVTGKLEIYPRYAQFQLLSDETQIEDIGMCSRKQKLLEWAEELKDILNVEKKQGINKPFRRIGVIGQKESRGLTDFENHRSKKATNNIDYEYKLVPKYDPLTIDTILRYLAEFNEEKTNPCDYICIVRGGDDLERLLQYSQPDFVRAIANSRIPVITGIAHDNDKIELLCDHVTDLNNLNGGTPTGAAEILNRIIGQEEKRKREAAYKQNLEQIKKKAISDKQQVTLLEKECERLQKALDEAQETIFELKEQLNKPKSTGILSFLFGSSKSKDDDEAARLAKRVRELYQENQQLKRELNIN